MKIVRLLVAFLLAPLVAFPVAFAAALLLKAPGIVSLTSDFDLILSKSLNAAWLALILAYVLMLILGIPVIVGLRLRETFSRRSLEIACALIGGVPAYFLVVFCRGLEEFLFAVVWLAVGVGSGALTGRAVWRILTEPLFAGGRPQRGSGPGGERSWRGAARGGHPHRPLRWPMRFLPPRPALAGGAAQVRLHGLRRGWVRGGAEALSRPRPWLHPVRADGGGVAGRGLPGGQGVDHVPLGAQEVPLGRHAVFHP